MMNALGASEQPDEHARAARERLADMLELLGIPRSAVQVDLRQPATRLIRLDPVSPSTACTLAHTLARGCMGLRGVPPVGVAVWNNSRVGEVLAHERGRVRLRSLSGADEWNAGLMGLRLARVHEIHTALDFTPASGRPPQ
ncbi:hypothetical protein [Streptomyces aidingensis]|uniref:Uncharacterized protein n=1 Tax=Streptomyces aidingensis TaxID=910347 RepID=A0A1I1U1H8_9ACTN|nr:hypothetical protein [Streptomyces aidingensis]SFD62543.1 hypothetical protein SAMN05421773_12154 [Streptomyces aidingensis]